jgi:Chaperone of endosialidase
MKTRIPLVLIIFSLVCFGILPRAQAVSPPPDGGYPGGNTAEGTNALFHLTTGAKNTANGYLALFFNSVGQYNTAVGSQALYSNLAGSTNTALGFNALFYNTVGDSNTAIGYLALFKNTKTSPNQIGHNNTATGAEALEFNTTGSDNLANGFQALYSNTIGGGNTATGYQALRFNTIGQFNTADGELALLSNTTGLKNTAYGGRALYSNTTGGNNIAVGFGAGGNLTTGNDNIDIGSEGIAGEASTTRIGDFQVATFIGGISGTAVTGAAVVVNSSGQLGVAASSARFKDEIKPMNEASEAILALKPVTFRYKPEIDAKCAAQFGLVAEDVAQVNPDLVARDREGKPFTVRYEAVNAMLLNEFLKEHKKTERLEATVANLIATVKEQAAQIQKVSAQLEATKPAPQVVNNP